MCREKKNGQKDASLGIDVGEEHCHFLARITLDNLATQPEQGRRFGRKKKDKATADLESKSMWVSSRRFVMNDIKGQVNGPDVVPCSQYIQGT
jgi:hypothetical protein